MIGWSSFIGNLVQFILSKIIGNRIDLTLDKKKRAAKAFLNLHDALIKLESINYDFIEGTKSIVNGTTPRLYRAPFKELATEADEASQQFIKAFSELHLAINIYDPALYVMLGDIISIKGAFIEASSFTKRMTFNLSPNPDSVFNIQYSFPIKPVTSEELGVQYADAKKVETLLYSHDHNMKIPEWPKDLLSTMIQDNMSDQTIADNNIGQIIYMHEMVLKNLPTLSEARKVLGEFLRNNFSLEDILYVKIGK